LNMRDSGLDISYALSQAISKELLYKRCW
jgi:post-segregation antitoxin (ccd killing protein)